MRRKFPAVLRKVLWESARRHQGDEHGMTRARFGRYVGSLATGSLTAVSSGREAWVACQREKGLDGFSNRAYRKALKRYLASGRSATGYAYFMDTQLPLVKAHQS